MGSARILRRLCDDADQFGLSESVIQQAHAYQCPGPDPRLRLFQYDGEEDHWRREFVNQKEENGRNSTGYTQLKTRSYSSPVHRGSRWLNGVEGNTLLNTMHKGFPARPGVPEQSPLVVRREVTIRFG